MVHAKPARGGVSEGWTRAAAALPEAKRRQRERAFWRALSRTWSWRRVVDAGCGAGFHLRLLADLGVQSCGFDVALAVLPRAASVVAADLLCPPLRARSFDAALCLGNTLALLPTRAAQAQALRALAVLVRPGGTVLLQGEMTDALVRERPVARVRRLTGGSVHVRVFERTGRKVRLLAGVVTPGAEAGLAETRLLPASAAVVERLARRAGMRVAALPALPPAGATTWWLALSAPSPGS
jgi:SAM-dependent methyltransferase